MRPLPSPPVPSAFAHATAVRRRGPGRWAAVMDRDWWIERGPNGGYVGATMLRAMTAALGEPARRARSVTVHYLRPPEAGPVELEVTVERAGRGMSTVSCRMGSGDRPLAVAVGSFGYDRPGPERDDHPAPEVPPPQDCPPAEPAPIRIPMREQYEYRHAIGPRPFGGDGDEAVTGGWVRLRDPEPVDDHVLFAVTDCWVPAVFGVLDDHLGVPTVDLTAHLRRLPTTDDGWLLVRFGTRTISGGFLEEDGEIWDSAGVLLATSRQLAAVLA